MKYIHTCVMFFFLAMSFGCKMNNEKVVNYNIGLFFKNTTWVNFNTETLKENKLEHFINDKIDFFHRESFFSFMNDSKYNNLYDEFYLIEIEKPKGERIESKKILVISFKGKVKSVAFKKSTNNWVEVNLSINDSKKYQYKSLQKSFKASSNEYILITRIYMNKF